MLVDSTSIPLRNLQSSPPASCHVARRYHSLRQEKMSFLLPTYNIQLVSSFFIDVSLLYPYFLTTDYSFNLS